MTDNRADEIRAWLRAGADVASGLLLFSRFGRNPRFAALVRINPAKYRRRLMEKLCALAGIDAPASAHPQPAVRRRLRDEFPFLRAPDCPPELKILAADKLTAYEQYASAHGQLFECTDLESCYAAARAAVSAFLANAAIYEEMDHYRRTGVPLGRHPIFGHIARRTRLRELGAVGLVREQRRLRSAIWRIDDEIKKGTKPHLDAERLERRRLKEQLLAEVDKLIEEYANVR